MNEERLLDLLNNPDYDEILDYYFSEATGEFDFDSTYKYTNYPDNVRYSDNQVAEISAIALDIARNELPALRGNEVLAGLTDDELTMLCALKIAKRIQHEEDKHRALIQGEEYREDEAKVDYYGTKTRAENKGYDHYMESHISSGYQFLRPILTLLEEQKKEQIKKK